MSRFCLGLRQFAELTPSIASLICVAPDHLVGAEHDSFCEAGFDPSAQTFVEFLAS
jgi:hypothetical protein